MRICVFFKKKSFLDNLSESYFKVAEEKDLHKSMKKKEKAAARHMHHADSSVALSGSLAVPQEVSEQGERVREMRK